MLVHYVSESGNESGNESGGGGGGGVKGLPVYYRLVPRPDDVSNRLLCYVSGHRTSPHT